MTSTDQDRERRFEDVLNMRIARFIRRYKPEDDRRAFEFEAELIGIVRECHTQAMRPFQRRLEAYENNALRAYMFATKGEVT